jgi:ATP-binding cassette subfamily B (MDR/TAP) protein 1
MYCWNMSGTSQSLRFKKMYYKALLEQEVAWYDSNDVNKLSTEVAANVAKI